VSAQQYCKTRGPATDNDGFKFPFKEHRGTDFRRLGERVTRLTQWGPSLYKSFSKASHDSSRFHRDIKETSVT
jgi:hypothetical protein